MNNPLKTIRSHMKNTEKSGESSTAKPCETCDSGHRIKAQFLATMSHELLTPLNGIIGMTELVLDGHLDAEQRELLDLAHASALDLLKIIQDMLALSAMHAGRVSSLQAQVSIDSLIDLLRRDAQKAANERGLTLDFDLEPDLPVHFSADVGQLRTVLMALISNAIKFTEKGGVGVQFRKHGEGLRITVADSGIGIAPDRLEAIFDPFSQLDGGLARKYGGLGIGLSIARRLVELMGGGIYVESQLGKGSQFHVLLP